MHTFVDLLTLSFYSNIILLCITMVFDGFLRLDIFQFLSPHSGIANHSRSNHIDPPVKDRNLLWVWLSHRLCFTYTSLNLSGMEICVFNFHCIRCVSLAWLTKVFGHVNWFNPPRHLIRDVLLIFKFIGFAYVHTGGYMCVYVVYDMPR